MKTNDTPSFSLLVCMGENNIKSRRFLVLGFEQNPWKHKANGLKSKSFHITINKKK